ncbi:bifunctional folylpolyglutamate synthase/dihydrofolate synthase [Zhouia spongiae]|uniref:Dihydrofolate synthase/folylpolyglutamate synthase n=1 Tax=Zhouia spongiae TaxID=2202721 RepID=A0ABY3YRK4_9FLAO|nr:folylpolyglutamate synthase/dihydrofolate synthase family protein [Zhouia spongiae]UNZ00286.1 bifunctional folylpolyglutamate synthase/dihydrofolate synthase [Zhouia spongiae]
MTYQETLDWMFSQLPMYQKEGKAAFKAKLDNIQALSKHLGHPETRFKSIHVAGTNGKGSTSHMLASILQEAGYKVGLYTSPHLKDFRERIRINGTEISEADVIRFVDVNKSFFETQELSFFEMTVGMAFDYFAAQQVDISIIEVGLGGRLDSTNIITPEVSVITNIGLDHTDMLGETLQEIAYEKGGIIKKGVPVVISEYHEETFPVFKEIAAAQQSQILLAGDTERSYTTDLLGDYQEKNIRGVVAAIRLLQGFIIEEKHIESGLGNVVKNTGLLGRWQVLGHFPLVIADTAHNREGLLLVLKQLKRLSYKNLHIVLGVVRDKKLSDILPLFPHKAQYYFCQPKISRALSAAELRTEANEFFLKGDAYASVNEAYKKALKNASKQDLVYIGGSNFVVAEIL